VPLGLVLLALALLALGAALLIGGAELFADSAAGAARRLGTSTFAVGLLLAGAEPEELATTVTATLRDRPGLAAGDAIGANVTLLTLALGLAALLAPVPVGTRVRRYALAAAAAGVLAVLALADATVTRVEGAALVAAYAVGVAWVWRSERGPPVIGELAESAPAEPGTPAETAAPGQAGGHGLPGVLAGLALMTAGVLLAVGGAECLVVALDRSDDAVGLTLLALATSAELLALVAAAARRRSTAVAELAVAGVIGSTAYNATVSLGGAALARPLAGVDVLPAAAAAALLPLALLALARRQGRSAGRLGRPAGLALTAGYAAYAVLLLGTRID